MEPEDLDIERITEDRRKAIEQNIHVISIEDLKSLERNSFRSWITHGGRCFSSSSREHGSTFYHATTDDRYLKSFTARKGERHVVHAE